MHPQMDLEILFVRAVVLYLIVHYAQTLLIVTNVKPDTFYCIINYNVIQQQTAITLLNYIRTKLIQISGDVFYVHL